MKKLLAILLAAVLCLSLCACPALPDDAIQTEGKLKTKQVHITAGKLEPGMTAKDILVEVTIDRQPLPCRVTLTGYTWDGYWDMADDEPLKEDFYAQVNVFYSLPKGCDVDNIEVTVESDGGVFDGTGSISNDSQGNVEAWSRIRYGKAPQQPDQEDENKLKQVHIVVGTVAAGMTAKDISVEVTLDGQRVPCRVTLTGFEWDGYWDMADDEPLKENFCARLNMFYSLPAGCDVDDIEVTIECGGGEYDGTGSVSFDSQGNVEAWSHVLYGEEPQPPQQATEPQVQPTTPPETQPTTPPETQPPHVHAWEEEPGYSFLNCTSDGIKYYTCSCGEKKTETVPAPGHDLTEPSYVAPTCTNEGCETTRCNRCGAGFTREIPATGHSWSAWQRHNGRQHIRTCETCGAEELADHNIPIGSVTCTDCGVDIIN